MKKFLYNLLFETTSGLNDLDAFRIAIQQFVGIMLLFIIVFIIGFFVLKGEKNDKIR